MEREQVVNGEARRLADSRDSILIALSRDASAPMPVA
jgi:hypothetical protein